MTRLGLKVRLTDVKAQKIGSSTLKIFGIVLASLQVDNKLGPSCFFQKTFLMTNISMTMILDMPFLTFSNTDGLFAEQKLTWRSYTMAEALSTTK